MAAGTRGGSRGAIAATAVGLVAAALWAFQARGAGTAIMPSYLFVWQFLLGLSLGAMALLFVHQITGGAWGRLAGPGLAALARLLPFTLLLVIPMLLRLPELFPWLPPAGGSAFRQASESDWYLNAGFFWLRLIVCFAIWVLLSRQLTGSGRSRGTAAFGLILYLLTVTVSAVDWNLSLTPHWNSTVVGLLAGVAQALGALCFAVFLAAFSGERLATDPAPVFHDLGNLMLALVMVWAYLAFMQFVIMWIEDLPHDISWYAPRIQTSWRDWTLLVVLLHFVLPLPFLLSRRLKRSAGGLGTLAAIVGLACLADAYWIVVPTFRPQGLQLRLSDLLAVLAIGGLWLGMFLRIAGEADPSRPAHTPGGPAGTPGEVRAHA